jgi:hypothetical protein
MGCYLTEKLYRRTLANPIIQLMLFNHKHYLHSCLKIFCLQWPISFKFDCKRERESVCVCDSLVSAFIKENLDCLFDTLPALPLFAFVYKLTEFHLHISGCKAFASAEQYNKKRKRKKGCKAVDNAFPFKFFC